MIFSEIYDDDPLMNVNLAGRQTDSRRRIHCVEHVIDKLLDSVIHHGDRHRAGAQPRVRYFMNGE